jgi:hypothetical protein
MQGSASSHVPLIGHRQQQGLRDGVRMATATILSPSDNGSPGRSAGWKYAMSKTLIVIGILIIVLGLLWPWIGRLGLGRLPGDIVIQRENFTVYLPITSSILVSLVLSLLLWLMNR